MFLFSTLFLLIILKGYAFAPDVSVDCPQSFIENIVTNVTGIMNSSVLTTGSTGNCAFSVTAVNFFFSKGSTISNLLCTQPFSSSTNVCNQTFNAKGCRCDRYDGNTFYYTYQFTANKLQHDGGVIQMKPNCLNASSQYPLEETLCNVTVVVPTTTTITTTTPIYTSETTTKVTITPPPPTPPPPPPFPGLTIALIVIGIIIFIAAIAIIVGIIKKCKKEEQQGNRFHCCSHKKRNKRCCPCGFYPKDESSSNHVHIFHCCSHKKCNSDGESSSSDESSSNNVPTRPPAPRASNRIEIPTITPAAQDGKKWTESIPTTAPGGYNRTEQTPTTAPGGYNRTEQTIQDAKEMQDRNKHLGTDNSPEREKRRKKKKKKKTFQEVDGEPVSGEDKSTVNDHKAAQNDNSIYVTESSHGIDNGGHRSLPMPKLSHLTSVERNSTIFQSETPRKLPPLQLKQ